MRPDGTQTPQANARTALNDLDDRRIRNIRPLIPPQILMEDYPLGLRAAATVLEGRKAGEEIVKGEDDRLLVVVGPCSIHDVRAAIEYAKLLKEYADQCSEDLLIVMRVYFEKPRTTVGWKGLINDPQLNGTYQINKGLRLARGLLLEVANIGLPSACELLDTISPQYIADLVSWGAIGARTTESQVHRELASGMSMPIGFKNGTDGSLQIAIDAIGSASSSHAFLSVTKQGISAIVETEGNPACHVILRGANSGPNYEVEHVKKAAEGLKKAGVSTRVMIDWSDMSELIWVRMTYSSHGNSKKKHENQVLVAEDVARQLSSPETADNIMGVMIESNLVEGKQSIPASGPQTLTYGQSVTDACIDWNTTVKVLNKLREGVQARRKLQGEGKARRGIDNRALATPGERNGSVDGRKDFNDTSLFQTS
ncbi:putative 3-deoxy-7-phosphoheptulonate synthase [Rhodotorula taiwanensis]|uniref:3-deoxy-7-phosphoheptulonate synthase n=1 Tax=Rhodotorula taiwanensis TaxID=741276 RepID=A0A2S5B023_9BASI|nr:putative 3-deoxy-7-phosphoheptulonate synthase [Rhodotorula taiwanensis]